MLTVKESPLLSGMYFIMDGDGEVYYGPFMSEQEAEAELEELKND